MFRSLYKALIGKFLKAWFEAGLRGDKGPQVLATLLWVKHYAAVVGVILGAATVIAQTLGLTQWVATIGETVAPILVGTGLAVNTYHTIPSSVTKSPAYIFLRNWSVEIGVVLAWFTDKFVSCTPDTAAWLATHGHFTCTTAAQWAVVAGALLAWAGLDLHSADPCLTPTTVIDDPSPIPTR